MKTASLLVYDIPTESTYPNPSPFLRRRGFRINLSCWVIPKESTPWNLLNEFTDANIRWHIVDFAASEAEKLVEMAASSLRQEIAETVKTARESEIRARARADANNETPEDKARYWSRVRSALSTAKKLIKDARMACAAFGLDSTGFAFGEAMSAVHSIQISARVKAYTYSRAAKHLEAMNNHRAAAMAAAVRADDIHPGIVADYLEENGACNVAGAMRDSFHE